MNGCADNKLKNNEESEVAAIVNGERIYVEEIVYASNESGRTYHEVLEDTINDLLIIQYGRNNGIVVTDDEVVNRIQEVKISLPSVYEDIEKSIGTEKYKKNIKQLLFLTKTREYLEKESNITITDEEMLAWYRENINGEGANFELVKKDVYKTLFEEKYSNYQDNLLLRLRAEGEIVLMKGE